MGRLKALRTASLALCCVLALTAPTLAQSPAFDRSAPITYFVAQGSPETGFREGDEVLAAWAIEAWARQVDPHLQVSPGPEATATIRIYWVPAVGGLYGETQRRVVDGRVVTQVFVLPDTEGLGPDVAPVARLDRLFRDTIVYLTCVHELGHAFGLVHTPAFADIMYSFQYGGDFVAYFRRFRERLRGRDDIRDAPPFSPADIEAMRALYP